MTLSRAFYGEREIVRAYLGIKAIPLSLIVDASALAGLMTGAATGRHVSPDCELPDVGGGIGTKERGESIVNLSLVADAAVSGIGVGEITDAAVDIFVPGEVRGGILAGSLTGDGIVTDAPSLGGATGGSGTGYRSNTVKSDAPSLGRARGGSGTGYRNAAVRSDAPVLGTPRSSAASGSRGFASVEDSRYALVPGIYTHRTNNLGARPSNEGDYLPCDIRWRKNGLTYVADGIYFEGYPGKAISGGKLYGGKPTNSNQIGEYNSASGYVLTTDNAEIELLSDPFFNQIHYTIWYIDFTLKS